jgi:hypothetical protein
LDSVPFDPLLEAAIAPPRRVGRPAPRDVAPPGGEV